MKHERQCGKSKVRERQRKVAPEVQTDEAKAQAELLAVQVRVLLAEAERIEDQPLRIH